MNPTVWKSTRKKKKRVYSALFKYSRCVWQMCFAQYHKAGAGWRGRVEITQKAFPPPAAFGRNLKKMVKLTATIKKKKKTITRTHGVSQTTRSSQRVSTTNRYIFFSHQPIRLVPTLVLKSFLSRFLFFFSSLFFLKNLPLNKPFNTVVSSSVQRNAQDVHATGPTPGP